MLITFQFPIFDKRYLHEGIKMLDNPRWDVNGGSEHVRYIGSILDKNDEYNGPWENEKKIANARSVFSFCGNGKNHYSPEQTLSTRILYRNAQSDGKCLVYFQIGFYNSIDIEPVLVQDIRERLIQFLNLMVKIRIGKKLTPFIPLSTAAEYLKEAYNTSTLDKNQTLPDKILKGELEADKPLIVVEYDSKNIEIAEGEMQQIKNKSLADAGLLLHFDSIQQNNHKIKTWFVGNAREQVVHKKDYKFIDKRLVNLKTNLLRVHAETFIMKRIGDFINDERLRNRLESTLIQKRLVLLLKKEFENISKVRRFNYTQTELLGLAYGSDSGQPYTDGLINLIQETERSYNWIKNLDFSNLLIKADLSEINDYYRTIKKKVDATSPEIYFSYAWDDKNMESPQREKIVNEIYDCLKEKYKVFRDKHHLPFNAFISDFEKKIGASTLAIVSISDKYFRSLHCMYELYLIYKNSKLEKDLFIQKMVLVHAEEIDFSKFPAYNQYWQSQLTNPAFTKEEHENIQHISYYFETLFSIIKDLNAMNHASVEINGFEKLQEAVDARLGLVI